MPKKEKKIPNGVEIIFSYRSRRRHIKTKKQAARCQPKPNDVQKIISGEKDTVSSVLIVYPFHCNGKIIIRAFAHMRRALEIFFFYSFVEGPAKLSNR